MAALGTTANSYEILSKLAEGGMAELFLARVANQTGARRHVVLKRIARERATDTQYVQMFLDEARVAAQLRHPNIAQVFDIGRLGVSYFFTMEYVHGVTVEDMIERCEERGTVLPVDAVLAILFGTAAGLQHAHERTGNDGKPLGIVHRDISPSNLMVSYEGHVKVVDFGVAKAQMVGRPETQAGEIKGKVGYLSPEQCRLQKLDRRSDLYSLGVVAWEMLTGKRLWKRETAFGTMAAIATEEVPLASEYREDLWPEVDALVARLLATEVADRFQSAREVIEAIELVSATTRSNTSPSQLARLMRELFGAPVEPWAAQRDAVEVTTLPVPPELDTHDEDPAVDTIEHKLTSVFMVMPAPDTQDISTNTNLLAIGDRMSTASGEVARAISSTGETREIPMLARAPSSPGRRSSSDGPNIPVRRDPRASRTGAAGRSSRPIGRDSRAGTELLPPEPRASTEILPPEMPTQRGSSSLPPEMLTPEPAAASTMIGRSSSLPPEMPTPEPAAASTIIGGPMVAPLHLARPSQAPPAMPLRESRERLPPSGDPTAPLGTLLPGARVLDSGPRPSVAQLPQLPASGPQLPGSGPQRPPPINPSAMQPVVSAEGPPRPRWPPPPHGDLGKLRWWILGGAVLGVALVLIVLISRSDNHRVVVAPPPPDAVVVVATTPDAPAAIDSAPVIADAPEPAAVAIVADAATADAPDDEPDDMKDLEDTRPQPPSPRRKLRTKPELNAAFREKRYKAIVAACGELGAEGDRAVVCTLAACRARARQAQDWYRNVPPKNREGTISICKQSGWPIVDVCAIDLTACRK